MIESDAELDQSIEQLERMYRVLRRLRSTYRSNPTHFQLFAEGPIDEIHKLRREIDAYLGIQERVVPLIDVSSGVIQSHS